MSGHRPPDKPCPRCAEMIPPMLPSCPMDWPGADEYDHYWCDDCGEAFELEEMV